MVIQNSRGTGKFIYIDQLIYDQSLYADRPKYYKWVVNSDNTVYGREEGVWRFHAVVIVVVVK